MRFFGDIVPTRGENEMKFYKNVHIVALAATMLTLGAAANPVTDASVAVAVANAWIAENPSFGARGTAVEAVAERAADGTILWWTVTTSGGSAIFTSADDRLEPVLAAVPKSNGVIPANHPLRALLMRDTELRMKRLSASAAPAGGASLMAAAPLVALTGKQKKWARLAAKSSGAAVMSLVDTTSLTNTVVISGFEDGGAYTHWSQSGGIYDYYMMTILGSPGGMLGYPCGCVATAAAAILQNYQAKGPITRISRAVKVEGTSTNVVTVGHAELNPYDWKNIPVRYGGTNVASGASLLAASDGEDEGEGEEIEVEPWMELFGRATYDAGVCLKMEYDIGGSGAPTKAIASVLTGDFGFSSAKWVSFADPSGDEEGYANWIYPEIRNGYPVVMSIQQTGAEVGHCVLAVGYGEEIDENRVATGVIYTRIFMGWGGSDDAWYALPEIYTQLDPTGQPDPEAAEGYNYDLLNGVVTRIRYSGGVVPESEYSPYAAQRKALAEGKPLLLISGDENSTNEVTQALLKFIRDNEYDKKFAIYFASTYYDPFKCGDTKLSIGVYNPYDYSPAERWSEDGNGLISYRNLKDVSSEADFSAISDDLGTSLDSLLEEYEYFKYLEESNTSLTISGERLVETVKKVQGLLGPMEIVVKVPETFEVGDEARFTPYYGTYDGEYASQQRYTFSAPAVWTNLADGIVWRCAGWSITNLTVGGAAVAGEGCSVSNVWFADEGALKLTWRWEPYAFRFRSGMVNNGSGDKVEPVQASDVWVTEGAEVKVLATGVTKKFNNWEIRENVLSYALFAANTNDYSAITNRELTVAVRRPVTVTANFRGYGADDSGEFAVPAAPAEAPQVQPVASGYPEPPEQPAEPGITLEVPVFKSIVADGGKYTITISGAVAGGWYWLYSSDDLADISGSSESWASDLLATTDEDNPQQADAAGDIVFHADGGDGVKLFWRAKATESK
jgi:hypothetical protein